jgi:uncharacterized membrane protein
MPRPGWTDEEVEQFIGNLLRAGVLISAAFVLLGCGVFLTRHGAEPAEKDGEFHGEPLAWTTVSGILQSALAGRGRGLIQLGVLLLIATPVARVAFSAWAFARQRDWTYVVVTLIVLAILLFSLLHGEPEGGRVG